LPRRSPFMRADIEARSQLAGVSQILDPKTGAYKCPSSVQAANGIGAATECRFMATVRHVTQNCNFKLAIGILSIRHIEKRDRCADELRLILHHDKLVRLAEAQETPGRKARALQLAPRWQKAQLREQKLLLRHVRKDERKLAQQALRRLQKIPSLPQSLEQEAVRELGYIPNSRSDYALLRERTMHPKPRGRHKSWALHRTIHALQACVATWDKKLIWSDGRAPPKRLIQFLVEALRAARIKHPNPETNRSKFIALMGRPPRKQSGTKKQVKQLPEPSELERRLEKVFL
jgi:hypothetical protein